MARYLALDWDQNLLHVVVANERGKSVQVQRALVWQDGQAPDPATAEDLGKTLRDRLRDAGIAPAPVLIGVGRDRVIVKEVKFPAVPPTEEPAVVRFQTIKELTDGGEDVIIDYVLAEGAPDGERKATALVVRRDILETYQKLCAAAGLKLAGVTPRMIGISHCIRKVIGTTVVTPPPDPPDSVIAVVVVGEKTAEFSVLRGSTFLLSRSLPTGSDLAAVIRRNLTVHAGQSPQHPIRAVYVSGKGSGELREKLGDLTDIPVHTFDPFAGSETLDLPVGQRGGFTGAMGLLFARAAGDLPINFVSPRQPKPPQKINFRLVRLAAVAAGILIFGLVVLGRVVYASYARDVDAIREARRNLEAELAAQQLHGKRLKGVNDWDTVVWPDELYDLTARIPSLLDLHIKSFEVNQYMRTANSPYVAKVTIKGELRKRSRASLDKLWKRFREDGYYSPEAINFDGNQFTLIINVERRAPEAYTYVLKPVTAEEEIESKRLEREQASKNKNKTGTGGLGKTNPFTKGPFSGSGFRGTKGGDGGGATGEDSGFPARTRGKGKRGGNKGGDE